MRAVSSSDFEVLPGVSIQAAYRHSLSKAPQFAKKLWGIDALPTDEGNTISILELLSLLRVLVVEDEKKMAALLKSGLEEQSCAVTLAHTGLQGCQLALDFPFDVIVLDVMLPDKDGFEIVRELRRMQISTPILFMTARDAELDLVLGLELGGDDYLTKPFSFVELLARIRALARRQHSIRTEELQIADLVINVQTHEVSRRGTRIELSRTEYLLLEFLMRNAHRAISRQSLLHAVWGFGHAVESNTLDVFIRLLRKKIDCGYPERLLHTVRGFGYRIGVA
jgi:two-component system response regulator MprA